MGTLVISLSGIRGIVGESFTPSLLTKFGTAFGTFVKGGKVVIGRDTRTSSEMALHALLAGLIATGCEVIDIGICPTPTILLMAKELEADGNITITASHNPVEWNGIEFANQLGSLLSESQSEELLRIYENDDIKLVGWDGQGSVNKIETAVEQHISNILNLPYIDAHLIREKKLKVVIDSGNGAGSVISPLLLRKLGCDVIELNCTPNGYFPRQPEPIPQHLDQLCETIADEKADIGFAHDADADRLTIASDKGEAFSGEYTLALAADFMLRKRKGPIVATVSTSMMMDDIADKHGVMLYRTKVGVGNVVRKMIEVDATVGGEGTGGVIYPVVHYTTDGITTLAVMTQLLAESDVKVSELIDAIPKYQMVRKKIEIPSQELAFKVVEKAIQAFSEENLDLTDGVKIIRKDSWVNIRKSGTEPVIRVFGEAKTKEEAERICNSTLDKIRSLVEIID